MNSEIPSELKLKKESRLLELSYGNQYQQLSFEFLRVHSPSAEVQGHGQPKLQIYKENVNVVEVEPVGNYGVKLVFDDGHDSGIYTWALLYKFCTQKDQLWQKYIDQLNQAGIERQA